MAEMLPKLKFTVTNEVEVSPADVARMFASMDEGQQATFWNTLAAEVSEWSAPGAMQWSAMNRHLTRDARVLLDCIHDEIKEPA